LKNQCRFHVCSYIHTYIHTYMTSWSCTSSVGMSLIYALQLPMSLSLSLCEIELISLMMSYLQITSVGCTHWAFCAISRCHYSSFRKKFLFRSPSKRCHFVIATIVTYEEVSKKQFGVEQILEQYKTEGVELSDVHLLCSNPKRCCSELFDFSFKSLICKHLSNLN
jgi:hypothetical protein